MNISLNVIFHFKKFQKIYEQSYDLINNDKLKRRSANDYCKKNVFVLKRHLLIKKLIYYINKNINIDFHEKLLKISS